MLEDAVRIARRVLGVSHPAVGFVEDSLRNARAALRARETPPAAAAAEEEEDDDDYSYKVSLGKRPGGGAATGDSGDDEAYT